MGRKRALGVYLQRSLLILWLFCIPISVFWYFSEPFLLLLGQDKELCVFAGEYLRCLIPGLWGFAGLQAVKTYLQAQSVTRPLAVIGVIVAVCHAPVNWLLIYSADMGFVGAAVAFSFSLCFTFFLQVRSPSTAFINISQIMMMLMW